ncbi:MAG: phosphate starvation-inducible protein PsiF [Candidatus Saccharibacteria bacterium]|nr:phosphate starvation-inducible protein PsiF [Rhodoferax sp.]
MKKWISLMALGLMLAAGGAHAADDKAPTAQQGKMKTCNTDAKTKDLKGAERKTFMKECLGAKPTTAQQTKMRSCNADAKTKALKGSERKKFMKECLTAA